MVIIGIEEKVEFVDAGIADVPAKIDTGAQSCSVWASNIAKTGNRLDFSLFQEGSPFYNGKILSVNTYEKVNVRNSFGHLQQRYKVKLRVKIGSKSHKVEFTLSDRSFNRYPVLIGRNLLQNNYHVDVTKKNVHFGDSKG